MLGQSAESSPEELLDVFKAAALSVTKLYKTSAAVQSKARIEGYQDCLEDLFAVIEKSDVDVRTIRKWVIERLDGREPILPTIESEDENEKIDGSTPEPQPAVGSNGNNATNKGSDVPSSNANNNNNDTAMQTEVEAEAEMETEAETPSPSKKSTMAAPTSTKKSKAKPRGAVSNTSSSLSSSSTAPTANAVDTTTDNGEAADMPATNSDNFTFRSNVPYPTNESYLELANLDLSDRRSASGSVKDSSEPPSNSSTSSATTAPGSTYIFNAPPPSTTTTSQTDNASSSPSHTSGSRQFRVRHSAGRPNGGRSALMARYNRAGQKRKLNFDEIFDVASLGYGKDVFGRGGGKRSRQA